MLEIEWSSSSRLQKEFTIPVPSWLRRFEDAVGDWLKMDAAEYRRELAAIRDPGEELRPGDDRLPPVSWMPNEFNADPEPEHEFCVYVDWKLWI